MAFFDRDITFIASFAVRHGFDAVELCMNEHLHLNLRTTGKELRNIATVFEGEGIKIASISSYAKFNNGDSRIREKEIFGLVKAIEFAEELGAPYVRSLGGKIPPVLWDKDSKSNIENLAGCLRTVVDMTPGSNVEILQATHDNFSPGYVAAEVVEKAATPRVGVLWCVIHPMEYNETPDETWAAINETVRLVHLKDALKTTDGETWALKPLGEGNLPLFQVLEILKGAEFNGHVSIEWERHSRPEICDSEYVLSEGIKYLEPYLS